MKVCSYYKEKIETRYLTDFEQGIQFANTGKRITQVNDVIHYCIGTKECDQCTCGGDESKCNFYQYKKDQAKERTQKEIEKIELEFYREYIFDQGLMYDALNKYEAWKKKKGIK